MPQRHAQDAHWRRTRLLVESPKSRPRAVRRASKTGRHARARLDPALTRTILADFLLNLSEYEIASVQVLSQRLDLLEELQATRAKIPVRRNRRAGAHGTLRAQIKNRQSFLLAAKHFLLAMTGRLEREHRKLEALVVSLKSSAR